MAPRSSTRNTCCPTPSASAAPTAAFRPRSSRRKAPASLTTRAERPMDHILLEDPELARAFLLESDRQMSKLEMIASENFASDAVREAQGSVFTHKYAERLTRASVTTEAPRIRRHRGKPRHRAREAAFRLLLRQRAAPLRQPGEHGLLFRPRQARAIPSSV